MNLNALSQATTKVTAIANLILVSPQNTVGYQPQNSPAYKKDTSDLPSPLVFNYEGEQAVVLESEITDHYTEENSPIEDEIALKPIRFTTHGFVGELNDVTPFGLLPLKFLAEKLLPLSAYTPQVSLTAALAYQQAFFVYQTANNALNSAISAVATIANFNLNSGGTNVLNGSGSSGQSVINGASGITPSSKLIQTQQQRYFAQFFGYWWNKQLFTIQTPWAVFQDMAIERLRVIQDAETRLITDFEITFKMMRFASTQIVAGPIIKPQDFQGRGTASASGVVNSGTNTLQPHATLFTDYFRLGS